MKTLKCNKCGCEATPEENLFGRQDSSALGFRLTCKPCENAIRREKHKAKKEKPEVKLDPKANAFEWERFVQPVQPRPDKWSNQFGSSV